MIVIGTDFTSEGKLAKFKAQYEKVYDWCVYCAEICPKTGKPHIQYTGSTSHRLRTLGKIMGGWCAKAVAPQESTNYCSSKNKGNWDEWGVRPDFTKNQGKRSDIENIIIDIKNGASEKIISEMYPGYYGRNHKNVRQLINRWGPSQFIRTTKRKVYVLWGPSGSGKTKTIAQLLTDDHCRLSNVDNTMWWNDYRGQNQVFLDDFKGGMKYNTLLGILDPWYNTKVCVGMGGDMTWMTADTIYITSTMQPHDWYPDRSEWSELQRRITCTVSIMHENFLEVTLGNNQANVTASKNLQPTNGVPELERQRTVETQRGTTNCLRENPFRVRCKCSKQNSETQNGEDSEGNVAQSAQQTTEIQSGESMESDSEMDQLNSDDE